jgi:hypothetical protein
MYIKENLYFSRLCMRRDGYAYKKKRLLGTDRKKKFRGYYQRLSSLYLN